MDFAYFLIVLVAIAINVAFAMYAGGIAEQKGTAKGTGLPCASSLASSATPSLLLCLIWNCVQH